MLIFTFLWQLKMQFFRVPCCRSKSLPHNCSLLHSAEVLCSLCWFFWCFQIGGTFHMKFVPQNVMFNDWGLHKYVLIVPPKHTDVNHFFWAHCHYFFFHELRQISTIYRPYWLLNLLWGSSFRMDCLFRLWILYLIVLYTLPPLLSEP